MATKKITMEFVRQRLMELHPGIHTSVSVHLWSHGGVTVELSAHPAELTKGCWWISVAERKASSAAAVMESMRAALTGALALAEAGKWDKPVEAAALATVHAG